MNDVAQYLMAVLGESIHPETDGQSLFYPFVGESHGLLTSRHSLRGDRPGAVWRFWQRRQREPVRRRRFRVRVRIRLGIGIGIGIRPRP